MTSIEMLQATVADLLSADEWLSIHGVVAYAENKLDIEVSVTAAITQVGIVATVVTPEIEFIGTDGEGNLVAEISALVISISEMTAINRERPGACTALDAGARVAQLLHGDTCGLVSIKQIYEPERGFGICNVTFATTTQVALKMEE